MKRRALLLLGIIALAIGIIVWLSPPNGPVYQGHTLSYWLRYDFDQGAAYRNSSEALAANKEEGAAWLIWAMEYGQSPGRDLWSRIKKRLQSSTVMMSPIILSSRGPYDERLAALVLLGSIEPPPDTAIPALIRLLDDEDVSLATGAQIALARQRPASYPALVAAFHRGSPQVRRLIMKAFYVGLGDPRAPTLEELSDSDRTLALHTLVKGLRDPDPQTRSGALWTFGCYDQARISHSLMDEANVEVTRLMEDPNQQVRHEATNLVLKQLSGKMWGAETSEARK